MIALRKRRSHANLLVAASSPGISWYLPASPGSLSSPEAASESEAAASESEAAARRPSQKQRSGVRVRSGGAASESEAAERRPSQKRRRGVRVALWVHIKTGLETRESGRDGGDARTCQGCIKSLGHLSPFACFVAVETLSLRRAASRALLPCLIVRQSGIAPYKYNQVYNQVLPCLIVPD
jgi:hypothetical protein